MLVVPRVRAQSRCSFVVILADICGQFIWLHDANRDALNYLLSCEVASIQSSTLVLFDALSIHRLLASRTSVSFTNPPSTLKYHWTRQTGTTLFRTSPCTRDGICKAIINRCKQLIVERHLFLSPATPRWVAIGHTDTYHQCLLRRSTS
jgi:hypothetical protein